MVSQGDVNHFKAGTGRDFAPAALPVLSPGAVPLTAHQAGGLEFSTRQPIFANERQRKLLQIFTGVERRVKNGWSVSRALRRAARRWKGRTFKSAPGREVNFSYETLSRLWYRWQKARRNPHAFDFHYVGPKKKVSPELDVEFWTRALTHDVLSFAQIMRDIGQETRRALPNRSTIERAMPREKKAAMAQLLRARRQLSRVERQARKQLAREIKRASDALKAAERQAREILEPTKC
jgi:hypothetical protein